MNQRIDLIGQRFGKLLVIEKEENHKGKTTWKCQCDCGNFSVVTTHGLKTRDTQSCGCLRYSRIDEIGNRYGKLLVIEKGEDDIHIKKNGKRAITARWICQCDCGNIVLVRGPSLRSGTSKSCGCSFKLPQGEASFNVFYEKAKKNAIQRGYIWTITREQVRDITSKPCFYCGKSPSQISKTKNNSGGYIHNGIDRLNNSIGYLFENCVPCCKRCNYSKHVMDVDIFRDWITSVYNHFVSR